MVKGAQGEVSEAVADARAIRASDVWLRSGAGEEHGVGAGEAVRGDRQGHSRRLDAQGVARAALRVGWVSLAWGAAGEARLEQACLADLC